MNKRKWDLYDISSARNILFGFATLIIMLFHSSIRIPRRFPFLRFMKKTGNLGVDIFLFLSAIGLYFSFSKNERVIDFYKRRMLRILPPLFLFNVIWFAFEGTVGVDPTYQIFSCYLFSRVEPESFGSSYCCSSSTYYIHSSTSS